MTAIQLTRKRLAPNDFEIQLKYRTCKYRRRKTRAGGRTAQRQEGRNDQPRAFCRRERLPLLRPASEAARFGGQPKRGRGRENLPRRRRGPHGDAPRSRGAWGGNGRRRKRDERKITLRPSVCSRNRFEPCSVSYAIFRSAATAKERRLPRSYAPTRHMQRSPRRKSSRGSARLSAPPSRRC